MNAVTTKNVAKARVGGTSIPSAWASKFYAARDDALALLEAAHDRAETSDTEIYFQLTGVAARLLEAATVEDSPSEKAISGVFYELLALCNASQLGNEDLDETAVSLVRQAHDILFLLACGEPPKPAPANERVSAKPQEAAPTNDYTQAQLKTAIEVVAGRTRTLQELLMIIQEEDETWHASVLTDAAQIIATSIGAIADTMVGAAVIGDHDHWNFGPNFATEGKAVKP